MDRCHRLPSCTPQPVSTEWLKRCARGWRFYFEPEPLIAEPLVAEPLDCEPTAAGLAGGVVSAVAGLAAEPEPDLASVKFSEAELMQ